MKNYKKIYKRLIKEIVRMRNGELNTYSTEQNKRLRLLDEIESDYAVTVLNNLLEVVDEVEGKKCNMVIMNQEEFKQWKKNIKE